MFLSFFRKEVNSNKKENQQMAINDVLEVRDTIFGKSLSLKVYYIIFMTNL